MKRTSHCHAGRGAPRLARGLESVETARPQPLSFLLQAVGSNGPCLLAGLLLIVTSAFGAELPANVAPAARCNCCNVAAPVAAGSFSRESIYQLDGHFTDDTGRPFTLGELRGRPVVLDMFFASCSYACPLTVTDMLALQDRLPAQVRNQTVFVLISFDVAHDTPAALAKYRRQRQLDDHWILLHGDDGAVRELAALIGVRYQQQSDGSFTHSNQLTILNREGEIVHRRTGLQGGHDEVVAALDKAIH